VAGERSGEDLAHGLGGGAADETGGHAEAAVMSIPVTTLASVPSAIRTPPITSICQSCIGRSRSNRRNSSRRFLLRRRRPERPIASRAVAGLVLTALGVAAVTISAVRGPGLAVAGLGNYERLRRVKAEYDPDNLFRVNRNIPPVALRQLGLTRELRMGVGAARRWRPSHGPVVLQLPDIASMTSQQQEAAVRALAALLDSWLARRGGSVRGDRGS